MSTVCFVDDKVRCEWNKRWATLMVRSPVYTPNEFHSAIDDIGSGSGVTLAVIHNSVYDDEEWENFRADVLRKNRMPPYVLLVNQTGLDLWTSDDGRVHASTVPIPSNASLSHLTKRLEQLSAALESIPRERENDDEEIIKKRQEAWQSWEAKQDIADVFWALHLLCEAWLLTNWKEPLGRLDKLKTALGIEGDKPELPTGIVLNPPSNRDEWLKPFQESGDMTDPLPAILNEMPTEDGKIAVRTFFAPSKVFPPTFNDVADLFLKLNAALRTAP